MDTKAKLKKQKEDKDDELTPAAFLNRQNGDKSKDELNVTNVDNEHIVNIDNSVSSHINRDNEDTDIEEVEPVENLKTGSITYTPISNENKISRFIKVISQAEDRVNEQRIQIFLPNDMVQALDDMVHELRALALSRTGKKKRISYSHVIKILITEAHRKSMQYVQGELSEAQQKQLEDGKKGRH